MRWAIWVSRLVTPASGHSAWRWLQHPYFEPLSPPECAVVEQFLDSINLRRTCVLCDRDRWTYGLVPHALGAHAPTTTADQCRSSTSPALVCLMTLAPRCSCTATPPCPLGQRRMFIARLLDAPSAIWRAGRLFLDEGSQNVSTRTGILTVNDRNIGILHGCPKHAHPCP